MSVGFLVLDTDAQTWGPWLAILAASATFDYGSDIRCDGAAQPENVLTLGESNKFDGPPLAGQHWPLWRKSFTGSMGAVGQTVALGGSRVQAGRYFASFSAKAKAVAAQATQSAARAVSSVDDPWRFDVQETGDASQHTLAVVTITLDGALTPPGGPGRSAARISIDSTMGTVALSIDGAQRTFASEARVADEWAVYLNAPLQRIASRLPAPSPSTIDQVRELLAAGFSPESGTWRSGRGAIELTFIKDLGSTAVDADFAIHVTAHEEVAAPGGAQPPVQAQLSRRAPLDAAQGPPGSDIGPHVPESPPASDPVRVAPADPAGASQ